MRIELQLKKDAEIEKVMAFLFKHTLMQTNFNMNLTCLVPTENPEVGRPERLGLKDDAVALFALPAGRGNASGSSHELDAAPGKRIHTLEGFAFAFDILDDLIKIIRGQRRQSGRGFGRILKKYGVDPPRPPPARRMTGWTRTRSTTSSN